MIEEAASRLEAWWTETVNQELTTEEAITQSGYSRSTLENMRDRGELENVGGPGSPRYRLGDLPRKAGRVTLLAVQQQDLAAIVLPFRRQAPEQLRESGGGTNG